MLSTVGPQLTELPEAAVRIVMGSWDCIQAVTAVLLDEEFPHFSWEATLNHDAALSAIGGINWTVPDSIIIPETMGSAAYA